MDFNGLNLKYILLFVALAYIIYANVKGSSRRKSSESQLKDLIAQLGFQFNKKVAANSLLFLYRIAPSIFKDNNISTANLQDRKFCGVPWLIMEKSDGFKFVLYRFLTGRDRRSMNDVYVLTIYDIEDKETKTLLESIDLPEFTELHESEHGMSFVFDNNSISAHNIGAVFSILGFETPSMLNLSDTASRSEHIGNYFSHARWFHLIVLFVLCGVVANTVFYSMESLSVSVPNKNGYDIFFFLESSPFGFIIVFIVQILILLALVRVFIDTLYKESEINLSLLGVGKVFVVASLFLLSNYFWNFELKPRYHMETVRLIDAANQEVAVSDGIQNGYLESYKIPLLSPKLQKLLNTQQFSDLSVALDGYHSLFKSEIAADVVLYQAYLSFAQDDQKIIQNITRWKKSEPNNIQPIIAEAFYYYAMAWATRGTKYSSGTQLSQLQAMDTYLEKSAQLINSIPDNENFDLITGILKIDIGRFGDEYFVSEDVYQQLVEKYPASYLLRDRYLISLLPKWGGGYRQMRSVIHDAQKFVQLNPRLVLLKSWVLREAGDISAIDRQNGLAGKYYQHALTYGKTSYLLWQKGKTEYRFDHYSSALNYLNQAIDLHANNHEYYYWRSLINAQLSLFKEALQDIQIALTLNSSNEKYQERKKKLSQLAGNQEYYRYYGFSYDGSLEKKDARIKALTDNSEAAKAYRDALEQIKQHRMDEAAANLIKAININPQNIDYYLALDLVLSQTKQWSVIINYWSKFLKLYPKNSRAHREVSGTYYHNREQEKSLYHLKLAADLGDAEAIKTYQRMKDLRKS